MDAAEAGVAAGFARCDGVAFTTWLQNRASQALGARSGVGLQGRRASMLLAPLGCSTLPRHERWLQWQADITPNTTAAACATKHLTQRDDEVLPMVNVHAGGVASWSQETVIVEVGDLLPLQTSVPG